jgi:hypothetical protein
MASIIKDIELDVGAEVAWAMLRNVGAADKAFAPVLTDSRLDGEVRTVTFASGMVIKEQIVDIDEANRRVAYAVIEGRFSHHSASMQVLDRGAGRSTVVWTTDLLPNEAAPMVRELTEQGAKALQANVRRGG